MKNDHSSISTLSLFVQRRRLDPCDYFAILKMDPNTIASVFDVVLKNAYHAQSLILHPDRPTGDTEAFQRLLIAYNALSDKKYREVYGYVENTPYYLSEHRSDAVKKLSYLKHSRPVLLRDFLLRFAASHFASQSMQSTTGLIREETANQIRDSLSVCTLKLR